MQEEKMHRSTYRVLKIFELLSATSEGMSLTGLAQRLEIPKGSLHPILKTMQAMNFIRMNDNGNYTIGQAAYFAGSSYTKNSDLLQEIDYVLKNLSSAVNQTAYFSVLSGGEVLYLLEERVPTPITIQAKRGYKYPAYATGIGKALLSGKTEKDIKTLYPEGLYKLTEYTIDDFDTLFSQMEETQKSGYSFEKEESNKDVQCIAVPVKYKENVIAGMSVAVPVFYYSEEFEKRAMEELKKEGLWFVCADMGGESMYRLDLKGPIGLVIGNEGEGVSRLVREKCDFIASIPMKGDIDSLNASVAAGVLAYEIVRQRMM